MTGVAWRLLQPRVHRVLKLAVVAAGLAGAGLSLHAQESGPVLLLQPGMLTADFLSAPEGYPATTGFNLRFATKVPTSSRWLTLLVGASVTPYGTTGITPRSTNTPILFAGNVFPLLPASRTGGWLEAELPLLLTYSFGGGGAYNRDYYGRDFVAELAIQANVGPKVLRDLGPFFSRLRVYLLFDQNLTPNEDPNTGVTDRFNPTALYGITIPIGGRRDTP
ncbi:MAG: hypothetical protein ABIZ91_13035 [Gemmatimonadaceae bacterium]